MINPEQPDFSNTPAAAGRPRFFYRLYEANLTPTVSVITPYYNTGDLFVETVLSVLGQSLQNWEWVIVDDGSSDKKAVERLAQLSKSDPRIKVVRQENAGTAAARNTGFRNSIGRFLCLLDHDDMIEPTYLEKCVWFLDSNVAFSFCNSFNVVFGDQQFLWTKGYERGKEYLQANSAPPIAVIRRSAFEEVGGFDEKIRILYEDWDFWLAMANIGHWGYTIPEYLQWYRKLGAGRYEQILQSGYDNSDFADAMQKKYPGLAGRFPDPQRPHPHPYESIETSWFVNNPLQVNPNGSRIMFIVSWMVTGGADKVNLDWIAALTRNGHQVTICATLDTNHNWLSRFAELTPDIFILPNFLRCADYPRFLSYLIHSRKIDTVLTTGSTFGYLMLPFLRANFPGTIFLDLCHVEEPNWMNGGHPRFGVGYQEMLDLNMVTTSHLRDWMVSRGASSERIEVCHSGIDVSKLDASALAKEQVRDALGLSADIPVIVFAGRICEQKRPLFLADILQELASRGENFQVLVIGDGEMRSVLENKLNEAKLMSQVRMMGTLGHEAWLQALAASDIFLLPSQYEGISVALLEAMGMSVVPVTAAVGGQDELLNADCGFLIPHFDRELDAYVDAVALLIADIPLRLRMGREARKRIIERFSLNASTTGLLAGLERARKLAENQPRTMISRGFAQELATHAVEYTRLTRVVDFIWNQLENTRQKLISVETSNNQSRHELEDARYVLNQTYHELQQTHHELELLHHEQAKMHLSRAYKLALIYKDFRSGKRGKLLFPFRLIWLVLPLNIKRRCVPAAHYIKTQMWVKKQPKSITNHHWPDRLPLITVIVCSNNGGVNALKDSVASLSSQTFRKIEILLTHNTSGKQDVSWTPDGLATIPIRRLPFRNLSYSAVINRAIKSARGKYLCCMDVGNTLSPTYLEKCLYRMETEGLDICGSYGRCPDAENSVMYPGDFSLEGLLEYNTVPGAFLFSKNLWKQVRGFDKKLSDDYALWDFWIRIISKGAKASCIPELLIHGCKKQIEMMASDGVDDNYIRFKLKTDKLRGKQVQSALGVPVENRFVNLDSIRIFDAGKVRILLAMPFLTFGGVEKVISQICGHLSGSQFQLTLITTLPWNSEAGDTTFWFETGTAEIFHLPRFLAEENWKEFVWYLIVSRNIQIVWQVGSVFIYDLMPEIKSSFPYIKIADFLFNEAGNQLNNRKYNNYIDLNITVSRIVWQWLLDQGETPERVVCIPTGINLSEFFPYSVKPISLMDITGSENDFVVGYCGRFIEEESPELIVEIANKLRHQKRIRFIMFGEGGLVNKILSLISAYDLNSRIQVCGVVEDVRPYLGCCDILLLPSKLDDCPFAVLQAFAMGVPVIASRVGSLSEIITNGENGFLCAPGNVDEFAGTIQKVFEDSLLHQTLCQKARGYAEAHLDASLWFMCMEKTFRQLLPEDSGSHVKLSHHPVIASQ